MEVYIGGGLHMDWRLELVRTATVTWLREQTEEVIREYCR